VDQVPIEQLLSRSLVDPRRHLDPERVQRYSQVLDELPPVTVFRLPDQTLLLADGYHRMAAAQAAGRATLNADIRGGSRADALQFVTEVAVRDRGLSPTEVRAAIERHSGLDGSFTM
jgi:hypothetical protein